VPMAAMRNWPLGELCARLNHGAEKPTAELPKPSAECLMKRRRVMDERCFMDG
jgi:hypothetical protein